MVLDQFLGAGVHDFCHAELTCCSISQGKTGSGAVAQVPCPTEL